MGFRCIVENLEDTTIQGVAPVTTRSEIVELKTTILDGFMKNMDCNKKLL